jgi:hypothetical protein
MFKSILMKKVKENKKQAGKVSAREKPVNGIRPSEKAKKNAVFTNGLSWCRR